MLELSMPLPIRVQNGGLFISRGVGSHPARKLQSWEIIFVEKGTLTICEEGEIFNVNAGESLLLWPERSHVGVGEFPADLKFYWLHFEVLTDNVRSLPPALLNVPQHTRVSDPQYIISLFRQFLREQENIHPQPGAGAPVIADTAADCRGGKRKTGRQSRRCAGLESAADHPYPLPLACFSIDTGERAAL